MMNELKSLSLNLKKKIEDYSSFDLVMIGEIWFSYDWGNFC